MNSTTLEFQLQHLEKALSTTPEKIHINIGGVIVDKWNPKHFALKNKVKAVKLQMSKIRHDEYLSK